jgi:hypothetical protein
LNSVTYFAQASPTEQGFAAKKSGNNKTPHNSKVLEQSTLFIHPRFHHQGNLNNSFHSANYNKRPSQTPPTRICSLQGRVGGGSALRFGSKFYSIALWA